MLKAVVFLIYMLQFVIYPSGAVSPTKEASLLVCGCKLSNLCVGANQSWTGRDLRPLESHPNSWGWLSLPYICNYRLLQECLITHNALCEMMDGTCHRNWPVMWPRDGSRQLWQSSVGRCQSCITRKECVGDQQRLKWTEIIKYYAATGHGEKKAPGIWLWKEWTNN